LGNVWGNHISLNKLHEAPFWLVNMFPLVGGTVLSAPVDKSIYSPVSPDLHARDAPSSIRETKYSTCGLASGTPIDVEVRPSQFLSSSLSTENISAVISNRSSAKRGQTPYSKTPPTYTFWCVVPVMHACELESNR
jgi:hypothetical protein